MHGHEKDMGYVWTRSRRSLCRLASASCAATVECDSLLGATLI